MVNSNVTNGADKISFVRSQLLPGSLASEMMIASCFQPKALNYDYCQFRSNFLQSFGLPQSSDAFQWSFRLAESLTSNFGSLGLMRGQARAAEFVAEAVDSLEGAGWFEGDMLSIHRLRQMLEFQLYILFLSPQERRVASSLPFNKDESLLTFVTRLRKRLSEMPRPSSSVTFAPVLQSSGPSSVPPSVTSRPSTPPPPTPPRVCTYCSKQGHTFAKCHKRQRETQPRDPSRSRHGTSPNPRSPNRQSFQSRGYASPHSQSHARGRSPTHMKFELPPKYCLVHDRCNHSSDDCPAITQLRRDQTVSPKSSHFRNRRQQRYKD